MGHSITALMAKYAKCHELCDQNGFEFRTIKIGLHYETLKCSVACDIKPAV